jgi:hypothetical protein
MLIQVYTTTPVAITRTTESQSNPPHRVAKDKRRLHTAQLRQVLYLPVPASLFQHRRALSVKKWTSQAGYMDNIL